MLELLLCLLCVPWLLPRPTQTQSHWVHASRYQLRRCRNFVFAASQRLGLPAGGRFLQLHLSQRRRLLRCLQFDDIARVRAGICCRDLLFVRRCDTDISPPSPTSTTSNSDATVYFRGCYFHGGTTHSKWRRFHSNCCTCCTCRGSCVGMSQIVIVICGFVRVFIHRS